LLSSCSCFRPALCCRPALAVVIKINKIFDYPDPDSLNPDPAFQVNPDQDPVPLP
jgi:hypothetical protein